MGFGWDDIKRETENAAHGTASGVGNFVSDPLGEAGRQFEINSRGLNQTLGLSGPAPKPPVPSSEDPRITALRDRLTKDASSFRSGMPGYKEEKYTSAANAGREELGAATNTIRTSANQRGLLYSGMREGQEASARSRMAGILAGQRADINREAEDLASTKEATAANVGLAGYDAAIKRAEDTYNLQLANEVARRKALAQIGEGVGYGFGSYFGRNAASANPQTTKTVSNVSQYQPHGGLRDM